MDNDFSVLVIDEAGVIDSKDKSERYFVLGGIFYHINDFKSIKEDIVPLLEEYRSILNCDELKSSKLSGRKKDSNLIYGAILAHIRDNPYIKSFIYIIDKSSSYMMKFYDKKSFKYNKVIQWMMWDLINHEVINKEESLLILMDNITLSKVEEDNLKNWLKNNVNSVMRLDLGDSKEFNFLQLADLIAGIPKLKNTTPVHLMKQTKLKILNPDMVHIFPYQQHNKYII
jgi:hypothetical protein